LTIYLSINHLRSQEIQLLFEDKSDLTEIMPDRRSPQKQQSVKNSSPSWFSGDFLVSLFGAKLQIPPAPKQLDPVQLQVLETYLPDRGPLNPRHRFGPSEDSPVQIHMLMGSPDTITASSRFLVEGVERSIVLKLTRISFLEHEKVKMVDINDANHTIPLIWVVDMLGINHDCHVLLDLLHHAVKIDYKFSQKLLLLADYSGSTEVVQCSGIHDLVGDDNVQMTKRGIVGGRVWDSERQWVVSGSILANKHNVIYTPFPLRETIVARVNKYIREKKKERHLEKLRPVDSKRSTDVAFFWRKGDNSHYANLRREVGEIVLSMHGVSLGNRKIRTLVRIFGDEDEIENDIVQTRYVYEMMGTKAIVVAQRDEWEDHFRLMDSLASGALVISDIMIGLPGGLAHGKNILLYDSAESLKKTLSYYLHPDNDRERFSIAKRGWELVMGHHRCWHRMEESVFGSAYTAVDHVYDASVPPRRKRTSLHKGFKEIKLDDVADEPRNSTRSVREYDVDQ
jgi:hypothetical protein